MFELYILIKVGTVIGAFDTAMIVIITGAVGAALAREQGLLTVNKVKETINRGEVPTIELAEGLLILAGGVALITPGILTDLVGLSVIAPPVRRYLANKIVEYFFNKMGNENVIINVKSENEYHNT